MTAASVRRLAQARGVLDALSGRGKRSLVSGAMVLAYHDVRPRREGLSPYEVSRADLIQQLAAVRSLGYRFLTLDALIDAYLQGQGLDGCVAVTFDDGYAGFSDHAAPVLAEFGAPATLFVPSGVLGSPPWWWPTAPALVSERELVDVAGLPGMSIGSHSSRHESFTTLPAARQRAELADSKARLEDLIAAPVRAFAYPYGEYGARTPTYVAETGYATACTFMNGRVTSRASLYKLPRIVMHTGQSGLRLSYTLCRSESSFNPHQLTHVPLTP